jgi:hypothetical protein
MRTHAFCVLSLSLALSLAALASDHPKVSQVAQLTGSDLQTYADFGAGVAVGGNTIAVVATQRALFGQGGIYVFEKPSGGWGNMTQTAKLTDQNGGCFSEGVVGISNDGNTIVAGLYACESTVRFYGWLDVYVKPASGWQDAQPTAVLTVGGGTQNPNDMGFYVSISGDGKTVVSPYANRKLNENFLAIYQKPAAGWSSMNPTANVTSTGLALDTVANNGSFIAAQQIYPPALWLFQRGPGGAAQVASLTPSTGDGFCCAITMNGNTIIMGAVGYNNQQGGVFVFVEPSGGWVNAPETTILTAPGLVANSDLGGTVGLSGRAVVAGVVGSAFLYLEPAGGWQAISQPSATLTSSDPYQQVFGVAVAISGTTIVVADPLEGANGSNVGAVYVFQAQ